jgi:hypothetical protein
MGCERKVSRYEFESWCLCASGWVHEYFLMEIWDWMCVVCLVPEISPCVYMTAGLGSRIVYSWEKDGRRVLGFLCELIAVFGGTCAERMS